MRHVSFGLALLAYVFLSVIYFVQRDFYLALASWAGLVVVMYLVKPLREHVGLLVLTGVGFCAVRFLHSLGPWLQWPLDFYIASLVGFAFWRFGLRRPVEKLKWSFAFSRWEWLSIVVINVPSIAVLIWYYQSHPEVADMWPVPQMSLWLMPFVVLALAAVNGLREEFFYRGLLQSASSGKSPVWYVIGLQAVLFGFLHFSNAFPQGWLGVFLTALWGAAIAFQYHLFRSISLSWVTHAMADAIMFSIILYTKS